MNHFIIKSLIIILYFHHQDLM